MSTDSVFPVASVTKLATSLAILRLWDQGLVGLDAPLKKYLPEAAAANPGVTIRRLLTHSAGLPEFNESAWSRDVNLSWPVMARDSLRYVPEIPPGTKVVYRSLNFALLGQVIEQVTGIPLKQAMPKLVFEPLGIEAYQGIEPPRRTAIIHDPGDKHAGTPFALWNNAFWRSWGEPWAGMVTTSVGALGLLRAYLGYPEGFLHSRTLSEATQDQTGGLGGGFPWQEYPRCPWGLGPMIFLNNMRHWLFPQAPAGAIGMGGYSGCAVFAVPERKIVWAVHGTRTCADPWWEKAFAEVSAAILAIG